MNSRAITDTRGGLRVEVRRALFGLLALAMFGTIGTAVTERAFSRSYSETERETRSKPTFFMESKTEFAGIKTGRVYSGKTPTMAQTPEGQSVVDDRKVKAVQSTGAGLLDSEVHYVSPSGEAVATTAAFMDWAGQDVTEHLPPASEGEGQAGSGFNWRAWAGGAAEPVASAATAEVVQAPAEGVVNATAAHVSPAEGGEKGKGVEVKNTPAGPATVDSISQATATASAAQDNPATAERLNTEPESDNSDRPRRRASASVEQSTDTVRERGRKASAAKSGPKDGESLKARVKKH